MPMGVDRPLAVFFDLDGTLADTAEDLAAPIHAMRADRGLAPMPDEELRPYASMGARGLILKGLGVAREDPGFEPLRLEFLRRYEAAMLVRTRLFPGMPEVLDALDEAGIRWGVVSNKFERYVRPILAGLGLLERSVCAVGGDTTPHSKPHPEPLLHGARLAAVDARQCIYVGDDLRDIEAGHAAEMLAIAAAYGFCGGDSPPEHWGADHLIAQPLELLDLLRLR
ncbi:MAG: HAD-IA family hydrolase [Burkholderiaceae bacterium]|nr:HAD-IA family hydrolase [Burkholderiaceae bacterium]HMN64008.1 HAD-IA family hydrolase [Burkholderiaceae bacterium]